MAVASNRNVVPVELKQLPQWIVWRYETRPGGTGKTKVPCQIDGRRASSTNPDTWSSYDGAVATLAQGKQRFDGLGFVFSQNDPYCGVDLDNCLKNGDLAPWADQILKDFAGAYTEVSPSGRGIKLWAKGKLPGAGKQLRISTDERIEIYDCGRFFAVTFQEYGNPIEVIRDCQTEIDGLYGRLAQKLPVLSGRILPENYAAGTRHDGLLREAGRQAHRFNGDPAQTFTVVSHFNSVKCQPPKDDGEVLSIVEWACNQERSKSSGSLASNWFDQLIVNQNGSPKAILANAVTALRHAPEWSGVLAFNDFSVGTAVLKAPPWDAGCSIPEWTDHEDRLTADWLQRAGVIVSVETAGQAVQMVARDRRFHPVREYLDSLEWDGNERIDSWLCNYLGAQQNDYTAAVGARWLISAVARIYSPGTKADHCLILEGPQGILKSTALRTLAAPWFTDEIAELGSKDAAMQTRGVWIIEIAELDSMSRADVSKIKAFMSRSCDRFRPPYGRRLIESPRQCVFAGTVNQSAYLRDETGGRRFWPVACTQIDIDNLAQDRDQLWAEVVVHFRSGSRWWLESPELNQSAEQEQVARYAEDPWTELIETWVENPKQRHDGTLPKSPFTSSSDAVSISDILLHCLGKRQENWTQRDRTRIAACLKSLRWERYRKRGRGWQYRRKAS
jgi:predicted P-loop ATPase